MVFIEKVCILFCVHRVKISILDLKFTRLFQKFSLDNNCFTSMSKYIFCSIVYLHGKWRYIKTYVRVSLFWPAKWWHWNENILFKLKRVFKNRHKISHHMIFWYSYIWKNTLSLKRRSTYLTFLNVFLFYVMINF